MLFKKDEEMLFNTENYHSKERGKLRYCQGYKKQGVFPPANISQKELLKT